MTDPSQNTDALWHRDEVDSPCIKICAIHPKTRLCVGCLRSIDEISAWSRMTPADRAAILAALPARRARMATRRGGRAARGKQHGG